MVRLLERKLLLKINFSLFLHLNNELVIIFTLKEGKILWQAFRGSFLSEEIMLQSLGSGQSLLWVHCQQLVNQICQLVSHPTKIYNRTCCLLIARTVLI